ncbi:hypothetical protein G6F70_007228 [Rhizopus microsporus]|nr:hypothetical protein G6F71_007209 [Rhizopus microsporus]KAG1196698.1 hypothetical protein G6F70_007228 [Rhizopus microsporus]KAG1207208.1 hypothetical protein G6F69_008232 [Rhizopus microsporus]KAG1235950.1 hypothetical protein G6F67_002387 [Rhizopus microsporus]KAG1259824.1 hypothetical protein G6F68_007868 [Rhizopus microsporus]
MTARYSETAIANLYGLNSSDREVIQEIGSICQIFSMTPEQVKFKWEAFALNANISLTPSAAYIRLLKNNLQREFNRTLKKRRTGGVSTNERIVTKRAVMPVDLSAYGLDFTTTHDDLDTATHVSTVQDSDTKLSPETHRFLNRPEPYHLDGQYNGQLLRRGIVVDDHPQISLKYLQKPIEPYRYMFEKIRERADESNDRLDYMGEMLSNYYQKTFSNPVRQNQETIFAFGRICSDTNEGKLNEQSVLLETSKELGMGKRVRLDIERLQDYALFPGQVVAVEGINHHGHSFKPPVPPKIDSSKLEFVNNEGKPLEMITAVGPFTLDGDLSFKPLEALVQKCIEDRPDIVLLMGPFIPATHPMIARGKISTSPEDLFRQQIEVRLKNLLDTCTNTQILLMPHANDMTHTYPLFPQPPFKNLQHDPRIKLLSNPSNISINGHVFSIANIDILFRLAKQEVYKSSAPVDRFSRLLLHLFQQHTYYPLVPTAEEDSIDSSRLVDIQISWKPDILIIPSQFKHFVKNVEQVVCINPGHLTKHQSAGSYARVILYPTDDINERVRVDLFKL